MNLSNLSPDRSCCVCDKKLYGRSDKVFCDIHCKNKYHSELRKQTKTALGATNEMLLKNYVILTQIFAENCDRAVVKKTALEKLQFNFNAITGIEKTRYGNKLKIYEFGWYYGSHDDIVILRDLDQQMHFPYIYKRWERFYKPLLSGVA